MGYVIVGIVVMVLTMIVMGIGAGAAIGDLNTEVALWRKRAEEAGWKGPEEITGSEVQPSRPWPRPPASATPEEIEAARIVATMGDLVERVYCCDDEVPPGSLPCPMRKEDSCPWIGAGDRGRAGARAWLTARGLSVEPDVLPGVPM